jgi:soluble lytic murein transglycosylase-like protein
MTRTTAADIVRRVGADTDRDVRAALAFWHGQGEDLIRSPDLAIMLAARYLRDIANEFGRDFVRVAAAYHQGPGKIRRMLAAGEAIPERLPTFGRQYVALALAEQRRAAA